MVNILSHIQCCYIENGGRETLKYVSRSIKTLITKQLIF